MSATVTARFGKDGITIGDPNRARENAEKVFQEIYWKAIGNPHLHVEHGVR